MSGTAARYYPNLPGVQTILQDGNLYSSSIARADVIAVLGTAQDGPILRPATLHRSTSAISTYGGVTQDAVCNLMKGIYQVNDAGGDNLVGVRVNGRYAETILLESLTPITLTNLRDYDIEDDNATTRYEICDDTTSDLHIWLAYVAIDPTSTAVIIPDEGDTPIPASEWVEGQEYWVNYKEGYVEFAYPPQYELTTTEITDFLAFTATKWDYSIRLRSVYPGSKYNTGYTGSTSQATALISVTVSGSSGSITITRPDTAGIGDIDIDFTTDNTNYEVAEEINTLATNNFIQAFVDGEVKAINGIVSNSDAPYTDSNVASIDTKVGIAPWTEKFFSRTWDSVGFALADHATAYWKQAETYRRFHYGANEEFHLENLPGVTGIPAPVNNGDSTISAVGDAFPRGWPVVTAIDGDELPYYYAHHAEDNFKQDLYNALLYKGVGYILCLPNSSGVYYDNDGDAVNMVGYAAKANYGVFDWLEKTDIAWLVPKNFWADDVVYEYDSEAPNAGVSTSFCELFTEFAAAAWERGSHTLLSMAYSPITNPDLMYVDEYVTAAINHAAGLTFRTVSGITDATIDSGRFLVLTVGPEPLVNIPGYGSMHTTGEALVAGTVANLEAGTAPTYRPLRGALGMNYELTNAQLDALCGAKLMSFHISNRDSNIKITDGSTMASAITATQESDYTRIRTIRIVVTAVNVVKLAAEPWIGKGNSREARQSLHTEVAAVLSGMVDNGTLNGYKFAISSTNSGYLADNLNIDLELMPTDEIRKITITVTVRR